MRRTSTLTVAGTTKGEKPLGPVACRLEFPMLDLVFDRRIGLKPLAELCYRMATSQGAGVDVRKSWSREARAARGRARSVYTHISDEINEGSSVSAAMA